MIVVDFYGAPGSGKSVAAAYVFSKLKMLDVKCELVTEFAKDEVWGGSIKALQNQAYVFGSQFYRLSRIEDDVDVAVVDSPLMLSLVYNSCKRLGASFTQTVVDVAKSYRCLSYFMPLFKDKYEDVGRIHLREESEHISSKILDVLDLYDIKYKKLSHNEQSYNNAVEDALRELKNIKDQV